MLRELKCSICKNEKSCAVMGIGEHAIGSCGMFNLKDPPARTNADKIRAMSDEELAKVFKSRGDCPPNTEPERSCADYGYDCGVCWLEWLKEEVKE